LKSLFVLQAGERGQGSDQGAEDQKEKQAVEIHIQIFQEGKNQVVQV
jgi:hypothetical protein